MKNIIPEILVKLFSLILNQLGKENIEYIQKAPIEEKQLIELELYLILRKDLRDYLYLHEGGQLYKFLKEQNQSDKEIHTELAISVLLEAIYKFTRNEDFTIRELIQSNYNKYKTNSPETNWIY